ncbi:hypothetical protein Aazo_0148 ['Nostoc azollae' 0708]|jgi:hypothetical protein|uniref:Uncharacterized protein n=1 Tax=Nostoc azollae (strain 0708) TaxID=551115 RepID=D7DVF5_NOSA0|nr:hypothetical protein Aazo_0148 ['Nostoc azollae' 0708]
MVVLSDPQNTLNITNFIKSLLFNQPQIDVEYLRIDVSKS